MSHAGQSPIGRGGHPGAEGRHVVGPTGMVRVMMATKLVDHLLVVEPRIKDIEEIANGKHRLRSSICSQNSASRQSLPTVLRTRTRSF
jgi:hypothetical protein